MFEIALGHVPEAGYLHNSALILSIVLISQIICSGQISQFIYCKWTHYLVKSRDCLFLSPLLSKTVITVPPTSVPRALRSSIKTVRHEIEAARRLPASIVDKLIETGLCRLTVPWIRTPSPTTSRYRYSSRRQAVWL